MDWSSDEDEDVLPVASLRLSGSAASPCFLVHDSQPSPVKRLPPAASGAGFLNGLSQVCYRGEGAAGVIPAHLDCSC